jgi:hypothetical protein
VSGVRRAWLSIGDQASLKRDAESRTAMSQSGPTIPSSAGAQRSPATVWRSEPLRESLELLAGL